MPLGTSSNNTLTQLSARSPVNQDMKENMAAQLKKNGPIQSSQNLNITAEGEFSLGQPSNEDDSSF